MLDKDRSTVHRCGTLILGVFLEKMNPPTFPFSLVPASPPLLAPSSHCHLLPPPHLWKVWNRWGNKPTAFHSQWSVCKSMQMNMQHANQSCPSHRLKERQESWARKSGRESVEQGKVGQGNLAGLLIFCPLPERERERASKRASKWMMWVWLETKRCMDMVGEWVDRWKWEKIVGLHVRGFLCLGQ